MFGFNRVYVPGGKCRGRAAGDSTGDRSGDPAGGDGGDESVPVDAEDAVGGGVQKRVRVFYERGGRGAARRLVHGGGCAAGNVWYARDLRARRGPDGRCGGRGAGGSGRVRWARRGR